MAKSKDESSRRRSNTETRTRKTADAMDCIRRLVNALGSSARTVEKRTGITNAQLFLLRQVGEEPGLTINELALRALTQQSTISVVVQRLEAAGLVIRERSQHDGRSVLVLPTARGKRLMTRAPEPALGKVLEAFDELAESDIDSLRRSLGKLLRIMHISTPPTPMFEGAAPVVAGRRRQQAADGRQPGRRRPARPT